MRVIRRLTTVALVASALLPVRAPVSAADTNPPASFVTYRVFATQYQPNTEGSVEVAVPDKCVKWAATGNSTQLSRDGCSSGYRLGFDYRVFIRRDSGQTSFIPVKDVGPWNIDDNYWDPAGAGARPRRMFTDLATGTPEAQAAFMTAYNPVPNCASLDGSPSGHPGPADQFGRCVLNPAGVDLSYDAAAQLGLAPGQNDWLTVTFMWEPLQPDSKPLVFRRGTWYFRDSTTGGVADFSYGYGLATDVPVMGDWNGTGTRKPGVFRNGVWYLRLSNSPGPADVVISYGNPGDVPVVGDWNDDGKDTVGVFRRGVWYLRNSNTSGVADGVFAYGNPTDIPVVGDWNNDGTDTLGVFRAGVWYLTNHFDSGAAEGVSRFGAPGDVPAVGDWNHDGTDTLGVFRGGTWYLTNFFDRGSAEIHFGFGSPEDVPRAWK